MFWIGLSVGALAVLVVLLPRTVRAAVRQLDDQKSAVGDPSEEFRAWASGLLSGLDVRTQALETDHTDVRAAVAHGIEHVDRVEARIRSTVKRATKIMEEHGIESPGLAAEAGQLALVDDEGSPGLELPPMRPDVGEAPSSIPGVSQADLAKVRGM